MIVKLLAEHHLEFLSLTGGCRGSSKSTLVKMSNCCKSHAAAHIVYSCFTTGILQKATIFTSVAMSAGSSSDVVEVRKHSTGNTTGADVLVNGNIATIDSTTSHFNSK